MKLVQQQFKNLLKQNSQKPIRHTGKMNDILVPDYTQISKWQGHKWKRQIDSWACRALYAMEPSVLHELMITYARDIVFCNTKGRLSSDSQLSSRTHDVLTNRSSVKTAEKYPCVPDSLVPQLPSEEELLDSAAVIYRSLSKEIPLSSPFSVVGSRKRRRIGEMSQHKRDDLVEDFEDTFPGNFRGQTCYEIDSLSGLKEALTVHVGLQSHWRYSTNRHLPTGVYREDPRSNAFRNLKRKMSLRGVNVETNVYAPPSAQPSLAIEKRRTGLSGIGPVAVAVKWLLNFILPVHSLLDLWRRCWKCLVLETFR